MLRPDSVNYKTKCYYRQAFFHEAKIIKEMAGKSGD